MVLLLRKRHLLTVVAAAALCGALLLTARPGAAAVSGSASPQRAVILDAGHGGADGGAVSDSGVAESGLNLAITLRLADVLTFCGYEVLLTRTGEAALCDDPAATLCSQNDLNMAVNTREKAAKRIDDSIYIMKHADCPAVLVECGFLSNPEETVLLQQPDYQLHMAAAIAAGFCQYCTNEG